MDDITNGERAERAQKALDAYTDGTYSYDWRNKDAVVEVIQDLLTDMHHLLRLKYDIPSKELTAIMRNARKMSAIERTEDDDA